MLRKAVLLTAVLTAVAVALGDDGGTARVQASSRVILLGRSLERRPIRALVLGDPNAAVTALVVGCIHGNEPAGIAVLGRLRRWTPPPGVALWLVPDLNPDGRAAHTRQNARGVDLNRNFPYHWRALGPRGILQYSGPRPLSEPESRIAHSLILKLKPRLTIWFHQPLALTDRSGGDVRLERRFARLSGLPLRHLPPYPGTATSWQDFRLRVGTAFVVELPAGPPPGRAVTRYAHAIEVVLTQVATTAGAAARQSAAVRVG